VLDYRAEGEMVFPGAYTPQRFTAHIFWRQPS